MKIFILIALFISTLFSVTMVPLYTTLDSKKKKNVLFKISNPTAEPVAVDVSILKLVDTDNNKEERKETEKVSFYPSQFVLSPKETKTVRVRYMGRGLPQIEEVYRVIAQELDIDVSDAQQEEVAQGKIQAKIKMRFSYEGLLFVKRPTSIAKLTLTSFKELSQNSKERSLKIMIKNSGNASLVPNIQMFDFLVSINGKEYKLQEQDLKGAEFRRVLSGKTNTFILKHVLSLPYGKIDAIHLTKI